MNFLAVTCTVTDLIDLASTATVPQYLLVEKCLQIDNTTGSLIAYVEADVKLLKQFKNLYAVLHFSKNIVQHFSLHAWGTLVSSMKEYEVKFGLLGYYVVIDCMLPKSFHDFMNESHNTFWFQNSVVDILNWDEYAGDFLKAIADHFQRVVIRNYDHFSLDPVTLGKLPSYTHDCQKLIGSNAFLKFGYNTRNKFLLGLSTHATRFDGGSIEKLTRESVVSAEMCDNSFDVCDGMSWDSAADIYYKLNVFIGIYNFGGVCIEDYKNDLSLIHPLSVYSLCKYWKLHAPPPPDTALPPNVLVPRRDTRSNSTSGDETTNPKETCSTNRSEQV